MRNAFRHIIGTICWNREGPLHGLGRHCAIAAASLAVIAACAALLWPAEPPRPAPARPYAGATYDPR